MRRRCLFTPYSASPNIEHTHIFTHILSCCAWGSFHSFFVLARNRECGAQGNEMHRHPKNITTINVAEHNHPCFEQFLQEANIIFPVYLCFTFFLQKHSSIQDTALFIISSWFSSSSTVRCSISSLDSSTASFATTARGK